MTTTIERRRASQYGPNTKQAPRIAKAGEPGFAFAGYAVRWGAVSEDLGGFREKIARGAFTKAIGSGKNIVAILDHEKKVQNVLGSIATGTLVLHEDDVGLGFIIRAADTQPAADAAKVIRTNDIGVSFAFICQRQQLSQLPDGTRMREVLEADLDEISLVVDPAYKSSEVTAVAMGDNRARPALFYRIKELRTKPRPSVHYLRRRLDLTEMEFRIAQEDRANPHHDENGRFHDGSPEELLRAARGRMEKAGDNHRIACSAYRSAIAEHGDGHQVTTGSYRAWRNARSQHQGAIEAAERTSRDIANRPGNTTDLAETLQLIDDHWRKWASPEYANPAASVTPTAAAMVV